ncbi:hypothetical protein KCU74_g55, partial [Aureobasidium melanogenum]
MCEGGVGGDAQGCLRIASALAKPFIVFLSNIFCMRKPKIARVINREGLSWAETRPRSRLGFDVLNWPKDDIATKLGLKRLCEFGDNLVPIWDSTSIHLMYMHREEHTDANILFCITGQLSLLVPKLVILDRLAIHDYSQNNDAFDAAVAQQLIRAAKARVCQVHCLGYEILRGLRD